MTDLSTYKFNHSMIRVKDPKASLAFYSHLGMSVLQEFHLPQYKQDLYFLAYDSPQSVSHGKLASDRQGVLELSHNFGITKTHNGNTDPKGFSHLCVSVDNIAATCKTLSDAGYIFQKGVSSKDGYAIVLDPDEYWVAIIPQARNNREAIPITTDAQTYRLNHTMLRVKNKDVSLQYYQDVFGMTLKHTYRNTDAGFEYYFLGYGPSGPPDAVSTHSPFPTARNNEGLLGLTWYYGTESEEGVVYHSGNTDPEGFGHICISVDDTGLACKRFEDYGVSWIKRLQDGPFRIAFIADPDGYLVEIIQNEKYKPPGHEL
ncbi:lactoylglutathione lyase [Aspergillus undulatus]|uniref:lactoylglutathione lyase n=1 Tax=Aspergillus undulatus TaxID=1810928 RepID=UPI003CCE5297